MGLKVGEIGNSTYHQGFEDFPSLCSAIFSMWTFLLVYLHGIKMAAADPYTIHMSLTTIQGKRVSPQVFPFY